MSCKNCACDAEPTTIAQVDSYAVAFESINKNFETMARQIKSLHEYIEELEEETSSLNEFLATKHSELMHGDIPLSTVDWSKHQAADRAMNHRLNQARYLLEANGFGVIKVPGDASANTPISTGNTVKIQSSEVFPTDSN